MILSIVEKGLKNYTIEVKITNIFLLEKEIVQKVARFQVHRHIGAKMMRPKHKK